MPAGTTKLVATTPSVESSTPAYAFRYGYVEERAKMPASRGFWPGFWTWQARANSAWTETDVYEYFSDNPTRLYWPEEVGR